MVIQRGNYVKKRKHISLSKKIIASILAVGLVFLMPGKSSAVTIDGLAYFVGSTTEYHYIANVTSAFDVRGKINGSNTYNFQTTYKNGGYTVDFEVDGVNRSVQRVSNGTTVTNNGVQLTFISETTTNGLDVHLHIYNPENNGEHTYRVAMTADVQLGSNDYAAIYKKDHSGLVVTQDDATNSEDYGAKVFIDFTPSVNTSWLGDYKNRAANKYTDGTVSAYTVADKVDTAAAWSWSGNVSGGETANLTTSYKLTETNTTKVYFYDQDGELVDEKEALVGGALALPNLSEPEEGYLHVWCEDASDDSTCYGGGASIIVEEDDLSLYENYIVDPTYVKTSTISFYDQNNSLVDKKEAPVGEEITLPTLSEPEEGYLHLWCLDTADLTTCYEGDSSIVVGDDNLSLHEAFFEDPSYVRTNKISFYDQAGEIVEERDVPVGEETILPNLTTPEEGYLHLWCEDSTDINTCHAGGATIVVEADLSLHESYIEDPNYVRTNKISFYDQANVLLEEREVPVGEETTLPALSEPEEGYLHLWCKDSTDINTCYAGDSVITVEEDLDLHEAYITDPSYVPPVDPVDDPDNPDDPIDPVPSDDPTDDPVDNPTDNSSDAPSEDNSSNTADNSSTGGNAVAYEVQSVTYSNNTGRVNATTNVDSAPTDNNDTEEVATTSGQSNNTSSTNNTDSLEKTDPLGVISRGNSGNGIWDILKIILPCLALSLFSFFFFIILFKRKKDDDEEEEESAQKS